MLYILPPLLLYFITAGLYLLISLNYFTHPPTPLPYDDQKFILCIYESISVLLCFIMFFRFHI